MPEALLVFTFSPVQPFILEARRTADLFSGSGILVKLSRAAAESIAKAPGSRLIFPAKLSGDMPNKLVARVPWDAARAIATEAEAALRRRWQEIADPAKQQLQRLAPQPDAAWDTIWQRQTTSYWEVYWAAAALGGGAENEAYASAYGAANRGLEAAKRTRAFVQAEEHGLKDTLSGRREALHTRTLDAPAYWQAIAARPDVTAAKLQPEGRERLDALGAVKRFGQLANRRFPSTSSIAATDFLAKAQNDGPVALAAYRGAVEALLGRRLAQVGDDAGWPYDGDLLYVETLTPERLKDGYGLDTLDEQALRVAQNRLRDLHRAADASPSPYYAVLVLDGDSMGERVSGCLKNNDPQAEHRALSERLTEFAEAVAAIAGEHRADVVYNGGDDVLLLAPLGAAVSVAAALARRFGEFAGTSASAGIAIAHHLSPLDAALAAARSAESRAKTPPKAAVAVQVLKRSGESLELRSSWEALRESVAEPDDRRAAVTADARGRAPGDNLADLVDLFRSDARGAPLAGRFDSDLTALAYAFTAADRPFTAELRRLLARHRNRGHLRAPEPRAWAERLAAWARALPAGEQTDKLARWVRFAHFIARGGED